VLQDNEHVSFESMIQSIMKNVSRARLNQRQRCVLWRDCQSSSQLCEQLVGAGWRNRDVL
jgi:hypothetical protein